MLKHLLTVVIVVKLQRRLRVNDRVPVIHATVPFQLMTMDGVQGGFFAAAYRHQKSGDLFFRYHKADGCPLRAPP